MSRAGLGFASLILFFAVCVGLTASAPLPERLSSWVERYDDYDDDFVVRSLAILLDREFDIAVDPEYTKREYPSILNDREFDIEYDGYTKREYGDLSIFDEQEFDVAQHQHKRDVSDIAMLRRRSFWDKIKSGFQRAGNAIKNGFHKVQSGIQRAGGAIRKGFQKAGGAIRKGIQRAGGAIRKGVQKVGQGFRKAGGAIRNGFKKVGGAMRKGFQKVGQGLRTAGRAMKKGFGVVGTAIKKNIGKVAKFGLKVVAAGATVASKLAKFVPGIGTGISLALKGVAMGANFASNKIHAHLPGGLEKASEGLDMVMNPMSAASKIGGPAGKAIGIVDSII